MNTPTYKAFIDFAADNNLEYIIIDDGWSGNESLLKDLNPDIDLKELVAYGNQKGVGIILWQAGEILPKIRKPHSATMHRWVSKASR